MMKNLKLLVKYENLKENTLSELKEIYSFLNSNISENEIKKLIEIYDFEKKLDFEKGPGKFYRSAKTGGWRDNFDSAEQKTMNSIMEKTLEKFGYRV